MTVTLASLGDARLVARCREGHEEAWAEFVRRFARYVHAIISRGYRLDAPDAEDVFQEVFTAAFTNLDRLRNDGTVRPWLAQTTRRLCIDRFRTAARETPSMEDLPEEGRIDATLARLDEALAVHDALAQLSPDCQQILDRFFCRDESYRQISQDLDIPEGTIASRISRCLDKLRDAYSGRERAAAPS